MALTLIGCCICDSLHQGQFGHLRSTSSALKDGAFLAEPLHQRPWLPAPPEFSKHSEPGALPISSYYLTASGDPIVTDQPIGGRRLNAFCAVKLVLPPSHVMDDNFSEGYRDCSRWFTTVEPPGIGLMAVANQQLEMVKASSGNGYMGLASRCKLAGDFEVQVDYRLAIWPAQNFHTVRLVASNLPDGGTGLPGVYRNSYADENYQFRNQRGAAGLVSVPTSDTSGTIRLKRTGSTTSQPMLTGYDPHVMIGSAPTTSDPTGFTIDFATPSATAPGDVAIAFDNFTVNAGTVMCPQ